MDTTAKETLLTNTIRSGKKFVRQREQLDYLKQAQHNEFVPRGIADQMKYVSPVHDVTLQDSIQINLLTCSFKG